MRIRSNSVVPVIVAFFLAAVLALSVRLAAVGPNRAQKESASSKNVEETVSKLLSVPIYTASDEMLLNEAGDRAAVAMTKIMTEQELNSPDMARRVLLILHLAFEAPQSIIERSNKTPTAALRLLKQVEHADYGRQPNVIGNARFEIEHNTSTGQPIEFVTLPGEPTIDWGHAQWVGNVLAWIGTIKPGMTRSDLLRVFTTEGGWSTRTHRTYVLKECRTIKVDVEFSISSNEAEDKIAQISRPYLDYGHYD